MHREKEKGKRKKKTGKREKFIKEKGKTWE
jgi:hypothetical protein